jgi:hypothetical protein
VCNETVANPSMLRETAIAALEATLKGHALVRAGDEFTVVRALPHGDVAAVAPIARRLSWRRCSARRAGRGIWCWG